MPTAFTVRTKRAYSQDRIVEAAALEAHSEMLSDQGHDRSAITLEEALKSREPSQIHVREATATGQVDDKKATNHPKLRVNTEFIMRSTQLPGSENIPQRASPGVKFSVRVFADVFTLPDYYSAVKLLRIPLLLREEIKEVHSHQVQKIFRNVPRRGLNFLHACSQMHSPGWIMIPP